MDGEWVMIDDLFAATLIRSGGRGVQDSRGLRGWGGPGMDGLGEGD